MIACANVANLLLARAASRQREISVRLAIGAGRGRIVRQLLTESALLAGVGAAIGVALASVGSDAIVRLISEGPAVSAGVALDLSPNARVLAFTSLVAAVTTLLFGMAPAFTATTAATTLASTVNAGSGRATSARGHLGAVLVIAQVAISVLLLVGAGLFIRTLWNLRTFDPGFRRDGVLLVDVDARRAGYQGDALKAFNQDVLAAVGRVPGVEVASFSSVPPLNGGGISFSIAVNGQPIRPDEIAINFIGPRYFETLLTPIVRGREFAIGDDAAAPGVAVVNQAFVRQYMASGDPLAQRVSIVGGFGRALGELQVVGVVGDAVYERLREPPPPMVFAPYLQLRDRQLGGGPITMEVRTASSLTRVAAAIRAEVQPKLSVTMPLQIRTLAQQIEGGLSQARLMAALAGAFGALALSLVAVGLYGLLAYTVARRTNEIGIRLALGAQRAQVLRHVVGDALRMVALGAVCGLPATWAASRFASSMLFGVTTGDPVTIGGAVALLMLTGVLAAYFPARRAANVDPIVALRCE